MRTVLAPHQQGCQWGLFGNKKTLFIYLFVYLFRSLLYQFLTAFCRQKLAEIQLLPLDEKLEQTWMRKLEKVKGMRAEVTWPGEQCCQEQGGDLGSLCIYPFTSSCWLWRSQAVMPTVSPMTLWPGLSLCITAWLCQSYGESDILNYFSKWYEPSNWNMGNLLLCGMSGCPNNSMEGLCS